jgi:hypothetical protein
MEDLKFVVEAFDEGGILFEAPSLLHDLDTAIAAYGACRKKVRGQAANAVPRRAPPCGEAIGCERRSEPLGQAETIDSVSLGGYFFTSNRCTEDK